MLPLTSWLFLLCAHAHYDPWPQRNSYFYRIKGRISYFYRVKGRISYFYGFKGRISYFYRSRVVLAISTRSRVVLAISTRSRVVLRAYAEEGELPVSTYPTISASCSLICLALFAKEHNCVKPELTEENVILIKGGRWVWRECVHAVKQQTCTIFHVFYKDQHAALKTTVISFSYIVCTCTCTSYVEPS